MIKKVFTVAVIILTIIYFFTNRSDATNFQEYKEISFGNETIKVAEYETINEMQGEGKGQASKEEQVNTLMEEGTVKTYPSGKRGGRTTKIPVSVTAIEATTAVIGTFIFIITICIINPFMALVANGNGLQFWNAKISNGDFFFNIGKLLTNQYELFDISYLISGTPEKQEVKTMMVDGFQKEIPNWYLGVRNLAAALSIVVLIYIGIRMAISVVADERAKYKKMLMGWVEGLILMFIMQYIIIGAIQVNKLLINMLNEAGKITGETVWIFEFMAQFEVGSMIYSSMGARIVYAILLIALTMLQIKFFVFYFQRVLKIALYIIISPLVCMTYAIDKAGDGKAQGFNNWLKEFMMLIFIQPIHLIIYVVFVYTAGYIAIEYPVLGVMFLFLLSQSEKLVKRMFNVSPQGKKLNDIKAMKKVKKAVGE